MLLSKIFKSTAKHQYIQEKAFDSLGLAGYNCGDRVCTFLEDIKYLASLSSNVVMIITNKKTAVMLSAQQNSFGICITENPRKTFFQLHNTLCEDIAYCIPKRITRIGKNVKISPSAIIADHNVVIEDDVVIEEHCVIRENTKIGQNSVLRAGCIIGGMGFEFKYDDSGIFGVTHAGSVTIGRNVEIQYNTCVDKAIYPWDSTVIGDFVKIDNLVHIGHAAKIGKQTLIVANSGIGGRVEIGDNCWIGFNSTIRNGLKIGNNVRINMGAVVTKNVETGEHVSGNFAVPHDAFIQHIKDISTIGEKR